MPGRFHIMSGKTTYPASIRAGKENHLAQVRHLLHAFSALSSRATVLLYVCMVVVMTGLLASCAQHKEESQVVLNERARVPPALQRIGQRAEGIVMTVPTQDWPRVYAYISDIDNAWKDYKHPTVPPLAEPRGFPTNMMVRQLDAALAALKRSAALRDEAGTIKAADDVNAAATDLFAFYNPTLPPDIHTLTVLERRILLDSADGDLTHAPGTLIRVRRAWGHLRPTVSSHVGDKVVNEFDQQIEDQQTALNAKDRERLTATTKQALTMIDQMERLYYPDMEGLG